MAGDAALSARWRVAPLRSRHVGIRRCRPGRTRPGDGGPHVKTLNSEEPVALGPDCTPIVQDPGWRVGLPANRRAPSPATSPSSGNRRTGHQAVTTGWVVVPCTESAGAPLVATVLRRWPEGHRRAQSRPRLALRFPVRRTSCRGHHPRSRAIFQFTGLSTKLFCYPQNRRVHPPFMHSDTHRSARRSRARHVPDALTTGGCSPDGSVGQTPFGCQQGRPIPAGGDHRDWPTLSP
jgi:hypothetical protein